MGQKSAVMPYDARDDESGKFVPEFPAQDFLDALQELQPATTQEVRERVGCAYRTAHARLNELEAVGEVESRDVGRAKLWTLADND